MLTKATFSPIKKSKQLIKKKKWWKNSFVFFRVRNGERNRHITYRQMIFDTKKNKETKREQKTENNRKQQLNRNKNKSGPTTKKPIFSRRIFNCVTDTYLRLNNLYRLKNWNFRWNDWILFSNFDVTKHSDHLILPILILMMISPSFESFAF